MNGVHDLGGMHGFGPVVAEPDEPVFHAPWEARVFALRILMGAWRKWNIDAGRHSIERMPPADYLASSYYEKWLASVLSLSLSAGLITSGELKNGHPDAGSPRQSPPVTAAGLPAAIAAGGPTLRGVPTSPRFAAGDAVRARNINPLGHTRLPRYVRGRCGVIERGHGAHVFPDSNAQFHGEAPQPLYTVRFAARELWGEEANPRDLVCLDLWEEYLEPA